MNKKYMFKYSDGQVYAPIKVTPKDTFGKKTCGDCGAPIGSYHELGCDLETDPRTQGQAAMSDAKRVLNIKPTNSINTPIKRGEFQKIAGLNFNWNNFRM